MSSKFSLAVALWLVLGTGTAFAGGPKYVAGATFFNPAALGQPLHWANGQVNYFVDQGPLSASVTNQQATAMVDTAAALWSAVPTAAVTLTDQGPLNEDVGGSNIQVNSSGQIIAPSDVTPSATNYPVAVIYDTDGSVINAIYGATASQPDACQNNAVYVWLDNFNPDATFAHGVILLNGLCATNAAMLQMMTFEVERAFGRILGLDFSQVNPGALTDGNPNGALGWPIMQPLSGACGATGGACIPHPTTLSYDDTAALNRIYPVTFANLASFPGKQLTAANTISIQGTVSFSSGYPMQGVNVVATPLDDSGNPLPQYTVSFVTGAYFAGNHGNPVTGFNDSSGDALSMWGSTDSALQGFLDLSGVPLPPGVTSANYQLTFEAVDPLYINANSVGPYIQGQVAPSGLLPPVNVANLSAGSAQTIAVSAIGSSPTVFNDAIGSESQPRPLPTAGLWCGRISAIGQTDWFTFPVRGNRILSVVTQAIDETGAPTNSKAMPSVGVWDAFDGVGSTPVGAAPGLNGNAPGETWLRVATNGDDIVRIGIADLRGDGRPDYAYNGWLLYADTVSPTHLPAAGGPITIYGAGFRLADTVLIGGQPAQVINISPNQITVIAPPAALNSSGAPVTGSVDVEVDDQPVFYAAAIIPSGVSYDSGTGDALTLVTAPANTVPIGVPIPFTVTALDSTLAPAPGVTVLYTVTSGTATLACGLPICSVTTTGDGHATISVTATSGAWSIITASLTNGSSLQAQFAGGTPPTLAALTPQLSLAAGATFSWTVQALVLNGGVPIANQSVAWQTSSKGIAPQGNAAALTNSAGVATQTLTVGPLAEGQQVSINACLNGTSQCVAFTAYGARPEYAILRPVAGATQSLSASATPSQITLRLLDMDGNPMAGGTVWLYQALYAFTPPCAPPAVCAQGALLATQSATATSTVDGTVTFVPASLPGVATNLLGLASSGNTATVPIAISHHP
ncbi:MAG: IPT/TIG domain-containing protein [Terracidiphilus sp.]